MAVIIIIIICQNKSGDVWTKIYKKIKKLKKAEKKKNTNEGDHHMFHLPQRMY